MRQPSQHCTIGHSVVDTYFLSFGNCVRTIQSLLADRPRRCASVFDLRFWSNCTGKANGGFWPLTVSRLGDTLKQYYPQALEWFEQRDTIDRKSTRLNSSH